MNTSYGKSTSYDNDIRHTPQQSPGRFVASANSIHPTGIRNSGIKF